MKPVRIFLSGPMGSGKSTIGRHLAAAHGWPFLDLDQEIAATAGKSVQDIFSEQGEPAFRALERSVLKSTLEEHRGDLVLALGGGTVLDDRSRQELLTDGVLVTLDAPVDVLVTRVATERGRPLLRGGDAKQILSQLLHLRRGAYSECHGRIDADRPSEDIAAAIDALVADDPIVVPLRERSYRVLIVPGSVAARLQTTVDAGRTLFAVDENVAQTDWYQALRARGNHNEVVVPSGEVHKTLATVERLWDAAFQAGLDRSGGFVAIGGGVTGDLAAFAASTFLRGVQLVQVPTTLLSMVDSSVGGKTGFDRPEGKNLVGTFYQPSVVFCDPETLSSLPQRQYTAGLAEVVKSAWLAGEDAVSALEADARALVERDTDAIIRAIRMSVTLKRDIVIADEREAGDRRLLNLGHTVGHALEAAGDYQTWLHGEAVALGLVAIFELAAQLGHGGPRNKHRMVTLLAELGLPSTLPENWQAAAEEYVRADKKRVGEHINLVVPGAPGETQQQKVALSHFNELLGRC